ncbi:hypothetical protein C6P42_004713 [Pichia californica]|nr:hypothetical protein C6P42_004713 [[Candida] californica]
MIFKTATLLSLISLLSLATAAPYEKHHRHLKHAKREADANPNPNPNPNPDVVIVTTVVQLDNVENTSTNEWLQTTLSTSTTSSDSNPTIAANVVQLANVAPTTTSAISSTSATLADSTVVQNAAIVATYSSSSSYYESSSSYSESSATSSDSSSSATNTATDGSVEYYANMGKGITYSPYTNSGSCKSESEIESDISMLSSFDIIRVYAPDCSVISAIISSMSSSQKIFAGLYYLDSLSTDIDTLSSQVTSTSRSWDAIYAVSIGNEWVNSGTYDASTVISAISTGRSLLSSKGYSGSVVTVDTVPAYQNNPSLCDASDFAAVNQHAFWNGAISPENSGSFLQDTVTSMESLCSGKEVLICETGWPTQGSTYQSAVPGKSEQLACIKSIAETVADKVIFFTTYNDLWKSGGTYGVEQYWGIFD